MIPRNEGDELSLREPGGTVDTAPPNPASENPAGINPADDDLFEDNAGVNGEDLLPGEKAPNGSDIPYLQPVQWLGWERRFGVERPYSTPMDEFLRNVHRPTMGQLVYRWHGLPEAKDIPLIYADPSFEIERAKVQDQRRQSISIDFAMEPDYLAREAFFDARRLQALIEQYESYLEAGYYKRMERVGSPQKGWWWEPKIREIDPTTRGLFTDKIISLTKAKAILQGRASQIQELRHTAGGSLKELLDAAMVDSGFVDRDGYTVAELKDYADGRRPAALPPSSAVTPLDFSGRTFEAEPVEAEFEEVDTVELAMSDMPMYESK